ncbi:two-component sensor histidine kinase [Saccharothrix sp. ALI-22-I]|uniref:sensor histidine kinase n=1 Tax=Saccharothrix sp. ALI-22-I TaxID=1933778 RepID=UPI00097BED13|nr:HAMP domain-containing sensor histidine kinase [Saccharothrix sp. ALI-22-I]ONI90909.1 two-component sensor histidine kinase [Saccharothrix sp. ALI-22-I]
MSGSAARLRALRRLLTVLFTAMNTAGLLVLAILVIREDEEQGVAELDADLHRVTAVARRLIDFDESLITADLIADPINDECPQFVILPGGAGPEYRGHVSAQNCVSADGGVLSGLATLAVSEGKTVWGPKDNLRVRAEPLERTSGEVIGAIVAYTDMSQERARHLGVVWRVVGGCLVLVVALGLAGHALSGRAIRPAAAALEQQEVLLAETAHDLRTPVAALRALAETALRNPGQHAELLPRTVGLAARMGGIIDGLLVRARLAAGVEQLAIQPIWLDQLVAVVVEETPAPDTRVTVTAAPTMVNADPSLLQRAIGNLLTNALRHGRRPDGEAMVHITVADGRVTVADNGPGIDPAAAEGVFDRFTGSGASSGLGLSIVRWVALAHGGTLRVFNAEEGGAIFELVLPASGP